MQAFVEPSLLGFGSRPARMRGLVRGPRLQAVNAATWAVTASRNAVRL